jgi:hypothetical protein
MLLSDRGYDADDAPDAYASSLYHLLQNEDVIKNVMFPITYYRANGSVWADEGSQRARYYDIGETGYIGNLDDRTLSLIADVQPRCEALGTQRLLNMAVVIRSKDAGINRLTFEHHLHLGRKLRGGAALQHLQQEQHR